MANEIELLSEGHSVCLPPPGAAASISIEEIDGERYVNLTVRSARNVAFSRLVRLDEVISFHRGEFEPNSIWVTGRRARSDLEAATESELTGYVTVDATAKILARVVAGTTAANSLNIDELSIVNPGFQASETCGPNHGGRGGCGGGG